MSLDDVKRIIEDIEAEWNDECAGYRSDECEACRTYYRVMKVIDSSWNGWDGFTLMKNGEVLPPKKPPVIMHGPATIIYQVGGGGSGGSGSND